MTELGLLLMKFPRMRAAFLLNQPAEPTEFLVFTPTRCASKLNLEMGHDLFEFNSQQDF